MGIFQKWRSYFLNDSQARKANMNKSPQQVLLEQTNLLIANSNISQAKFVHDLLLPTLIDAGLEEPDDHKTADEYEKWRAAKVRQINSILNGNTNIPLSWLWCWVDVLPNPYKAYARQEILALGGQLSVNSEGISNLVSGGSHRTTLPSLFREVADVMEAAAEVVSDGVIDHNDDPEKGAIKIGIKVKAFVNGV